MHPARMSAPQSCLSSKKNFYNKENNINEQAVGVETAVQALCQAVHNSSSMVVRAQCISTFVESLTAEKQQQVHQEKETAQQESLKDCLALSQAEQRAASLDSNTDLDWYREEIERLRAAEDQTHKQHANQAAMLQAVAKRFAALLQHLERTRQEEALKAHKAVLGLRSKLKAARKAFSALQDREDDLSICNQQVNEFWAHIAHRVSSTQATLERREQTLAEATTRLHETEQKLASVQQELLVLKQEGGKGGAVPTSQHSDTCEFGGFSVSNPVVEPPLLLDMSSPASATFSKWREAIVEESSTDSSSLAGRCPSPADSDISVGFFVLEDMSDEEECDEHQQPGTPVLSEESSCEYSSDEGSSSGSSRRSSVESCSIEGNNSLSCCVAVPQHPMGMDRSSSGSDSTPWGDSSSDLAAVSWWGGSDLWCVGPVVSTQAVPQAASGGGAGGVSVAAVGDSWSAVVSSVTELSSSISAWFGGWS